MDGTLSSKFKTVSIDLTHLVNNDTTSQTCLTYREAVHGCIVVAIKQCSKNPYRPTKR